MHKITQVSILSGNQCHLSDVVYRMALGLQSE